MRISRPMYLYTGVILISLTIIGYTLYYFYETMGGFNKLKVEKLDPIERTISGQAYKGKAQTAEYEEIVSRCADQIINNKLNGVLTIIDYISDTLETNEVNLFIGITLNTSMSEVPYDFEIRKFATNKRYAVALSMHPMVRPSIDRVESLLSEQARLDGEDLLPMYIELYNTDDTMVVEAWTK